MPSHTISYGKLFKLFSKLVLTAFWGCQRSI